MEDDIHAQLPGFVDLLLDAICVVDAEGRYVYVSAGFERIFGYKPDEVIGRNMLDLVAPEDRERTIRTASAIMDGDPQFHFENCYIRKDGQRVHIMWSARWSEADQLRIAVARDITARKKAEALQAAVYAISEAAHAAEDLKALYKRIHSIIGELMPATNFSLATYNEESGDLCFPYEIDEHNNTCAMQAAGTGAFCREIVLKGEPLLIGSCDFYSLPEHLWAMKTCDAICWLGVPLVSARGTIGALILKSYANECHYSEQDKELLQYVSTQVVTAIERKQMQARLQYMAQFDRLTNLPNSGLLYDRMEQALAQARRHKQRMAILYLDLDRFKFVNDNLGHQAGDELLQEVALRLKSCMRESDTVGRMGGDEFVIVLPNVDLPEHVLLVVNKVQDAICMPVTLGDVSVRIVPSIGVACYPEHGDNVRQLVKHADDEMYKAKHNSESRRNGSEQVIVSEKV